MGGLDCRDVTGSYPDFRMTPGNWSYPSSDAGKLKSFDTKNLASLKGTREKGPLLSGGECNCWSQLKSRSVRAGSE